VREACDVEDVPRALPRRVSIGWRGWLAEEGGVGAPSGALGRGLWTPERWLRVAVMAPSSTRRAVAVSAGPRPWPCGWRGAASDGRGPPLATAPDLGLSSPPTIDVGVPRPDLLDSARRTVVGGSGPGETPG
jgi:hypothetical protein